MIDTLKSALMTAGDIQLRHFDRPIETLEKESISSVVTHVDLESERQIIKIIQADFPSHNIISEECGFIDHKSDYTWIIDPIDGTSNYAAGIPWFGVLIALLEKQNPVLAGAYLPVQKSLYLAEAGKGSTLNGGSIHVSELDLKNTLFTFSTDYTDDQNYLNKGIDLYKFTVMNSRNVRTTNSLVDLMYVAEGKIGGCINLFNKVWDIAAPYLIISEAGGIVKSLTGQALLFEINQKTMYKNYSVMATTQKIYENFRYLLK